VRAVGRATVLRGAAAARAGRGAGAEEERLEGVGGAAVGLHVAQEAARDAVGEDDAVQLAREGLGVHVAAEVALLARDVAGGGEGAEPALLDADEFLADDAGAVVHLEGGGGQEVAAVRGAGALEGEPVVGEGAEARLAGLGAERGEEDVGVEAIGGALEDGELEPLAGAEVGEEARLGEVEGLGEDADGEAVEADGAGEGLRRGCDRECGRLWSCATI
jgi:hypothetical protein